MRRPTQSPSLNAVVLTVGLMGTLFAPCFATGVPKSPKINQRDLCQSLLSPELIPLNEETRLRLIQLELASLKDRFRLLTPDEFKTAFKAELEPLGLTVSRDRIPMRNTWIAEVKKNIPADLLKKMEAKVFDAVKKVFVQNISENLLVNETRLGKCLGTHPHETKELIESLGYKDLHEALDRVREKNPSVFKETLDERFFSSERRERLQEAIEKKKKKSGKIITFKLVEGTPVRQSDLDPVLKYAEKIDAIIIAAPAFAEIGSIPKETLTLFENQPRIHLFFDHQLWIKNDILLINSGALDKLKNPFSSLPPLDAKTKVVLFHPDIRSETHADPSFALGAGFRTTSGAITPPQYRGRYNVSMSTDGQANMTHRPNFTVIDFGFGDPKMPRGLQNINSAQIRRVEYDSGTLAYYDLSYKITPQGIQPNTLIPALVLGDTHIGVESQGYLMAVKRLLSNLGVFEGENRLGALILNDVIDGFAINHHVSKKPLTKSRAGPVAQSLEANIRKAVAFINEIALALPETEIVIPPCNHFHDWLKATLDSPEILKEMQGSNLRLLTHLQATVLQKSVDPVEYLYLQYGLLPDRVHFLSSQQDFKLPIPGAAPRLGRRQGVSALHGQYGVNGAKGISLKSISEVYGSAVRGHTHASAEHGSGKTVGTGTRIPQGYQTGPSRNDASLALVYGEESVQILRMTGPDFAPNRREDSPSAQVLGDDVRFIPWPNPEHRTSDQYRSNPPTERKTR